MSAPNVAATAARADMPLCWLLQADGLGGSTWLTARPGGLREVCRRLLTGLQVQLLLTPVLEHSMGLAAVQSTVRSCELCRGQ